jgi:pyrroline-5-carboxylate reductase
MKLGFLGTGAITSAMVTGLCSPEGGEYEILLSPRNAEVAAGLARRFPQASNQEVVDGSDTVVIAVRPQVTESVLAELRFPAGRNVISLVSGFSVRRLAGLVAPATNIARAVPLPSAAKRRSPTAIYPHAPEAVALFTRLGAAFAVESEDEFDAFCSTTAIMATYFAFADGAASWLTRHGIPPGKARDYIARLYFGMANTAMEEPERSFDVLAADHATRSGTNEQVLKHLTSHGVFEQFSEALDGIMRRVTAASR